MQMALIQGTVLIRGSGDKMIKNLDNFGITIDRLLVPGGRFHRVKEILRRNFIFIEG